MKKRKRLKKRRLWLWIIVGLVFAWLALWPKVWMYSRDSYDVLYYPKADWTPVYSCDSTTACPIVEYWHKNGPVPVRTDEMRGKWVKIFQFEGFIQLKDLQEEKRFK